MEKTSASFSPSPLPRSSAPPLYFVVAVFALALIELPLIAFVYDPFIIEAADPLWRSVQSTLRAAVPAVIFALVAFGVMLAPSRHILIEQWRSASADHHGHTALWFNLAGFVFWLGVTKAFNIYGAGIDGAPWLLFAIWTAGSIGLYCVLALALAPGPFWHRLFIRYRWQGVVSAGAATVILAAALLSQQSWGTLADATFALSAFLLGLFENDVIAEPARRILGAGDFKVNIAAECSGYEGIGLVTVFLSLYLWVFRKELRFPNAWALLPIGIITIWLMNAVRIALLIIIGENVSSEVAITGFHSQAGWMMFLIVTISIMLATHKISFFHNEASLSRNSAAPESYHLTLALLAPFLAITLAGIVATAFSAGGYWLYGLRVIAVGAALLWFMPYYRRLDWRIGVEPILLGLIVGAAWIATDPGRGEASELGIWLAGLAPGAAALWIALRLIGTIALVPIAEELAFRGYLHRKLIAERFETVSEGAFAWKAFIVTTILFGALHERWLTGALAGAVFAIALYRSGKLSGAIVAHIAANALIAAWALGFGQWSLF